MTSIQIIGPELPTQPIDGNREDRSANLPADFAGMIALFMAHSALRQTAWPDVPPPLPSEEGSVEPPQPRGAVGPPGWLPVHLQGTLALAAPSPQAAAGPLQRAPLDPEGLPLPEEAQQQQPPGLNRAQAEPAGPEAKPSLPAQRASPQLPVPEASHWPPPAPAVHASGVGEALLYLLRSYPSPPAGKADDAVHSILSKEREAVPPLPHPGPEAPGTARPSEGMPTQQAGEADVPTGGRLQLEGVLDTHAWGTARKGEASSTPRAMGRAAAEGTAQASPWDDTAHPAPHGVGPAAAQLHGPADGVQTAPAVRPSSAPANLPEVTGQIVHRASLMAVGEAAVFSLHLEPPELGRLKVKLSLGQDGLAVELNPSTPHAQQALGATVTELRDALAARGLAVASLTVAPDASSQSLAATAHNGSGHPSEGGGWAGGQIAPSPTARLESDQDMPAALPATGRIDIRI